MTGHRPLTDRQREVLILMCGEDCSIDDTADRLGIRPTTVKAHQANARKALGKKHFSSTCFLLGVRAAELLRSRDGGDGGS